jgi:hypothetical protein
MKNNQLRGFTQYPKQVKFKNFDVFCGIQSQIGAEIRKIIRTQKRPGKSPGPCIYQTNLTFSLSSERISVALPRSYMPGE